MLIASMFFLLLKINQLMLLFAICLMVQLLDAKETLELL